MDRGASCFPIRLRRDDLFTITKLDGNEDHLDLINLSDKALEYLSRIQVFRGREDSLFYHAIAIMHAPGYRTENAGALRQDWPRIPLPPTAEQLLISAELGKQITALFNVETPVPNVTNGDIRPELANIGIATRIGGGSLADDEYRVMARWGIRGNGGVTMPSTGRMVLRDYTSKERATWGERSEFNERALGAKTYDVYLNDAAYWRNIPLRVWEYTIGGYQVIKKWLSYREFGLLGRPLKPDEVGEVTNMVRRIAALLLLEETLDANYAAVKLATVPLNVS
jgi:hypothetical protein